MSQSRNVFFEAPEGNLGEVVPFPTHYELATEENIDRLGHTIKLRSVDYGKPLADPEQERKRQSSRYMLEDWKPLEFVRNESGLLIKAINYNPAISESSRVSAPPYALFPPQLLSGLRVVNLEDGQQGIAFRYYKQLQGEESDERTIIPYGFAYGVHTGHLGVPERDIPAEPEGWYMVGEQVRQQDGHVFSDGERTFPLSRIIDGPIGDPRDPKHRQAYGIY